MNTAEKAGVALENLFYKYNDRPVLFLTSAGSALEILEYVSGKNLGSNITICVIDERYDDANSNFGALAKTAFCTAARENGAHFIDTRIQGNETQEQLTLRFEDELRMWKQNHKNGVVIATLGMGKDGHTAGIMPYPENPAFFEKTFVETDKWVQSYDAGKKNPFPLRITTTIPFLQHAIDEIIFYVCGSEKNHAFEKVTGERGELFETPARIIRSTKARVQIFTDIQRK